MTRLESVIGRVRASACPQLHVPPRATAPPAPPQGRSWPDHPPLVRGRDRVRRRRRPELRGVDRQRRRLRALAVEPQAAGQGRDVRRPGRGRHAPRRHPGRHPAHADLVQVDPAGDEGRHDRGRGPALLRAPGRRPRGRRPRRGEEHRVRRRHGPGRLHADDAVGAQPLHRRRHPLGPRGLQAQDPRGAPGRGARGRPPRAGRQALDPHEVHQQRPVRHGGRPDRRRRLRRGPRLLQQAGEPARAARGRAARRASAGALPLQPVHQRRPREGPPRRRPAPHGRRGLHHPRAGAGGDGPRPRRPLLALLHAARRGLLLRLRPSAADRRVRHRPRPRRRPARPHDARPQAPARCAQGPGERRRRPGPLRRDRLHRPAQRPRRRDGLQRQVRRVQVQPRRAGQVRRRARPSRR